MTSVGDFLVTKNIECEKINGNTPTFSTGLTLQDVTNNGATTTDTVKVQ